MNTSWYDESLTNDSAKVATSFVRDASPSIAGIKARAVKTCERSNWTLLAACRAPSAKLFMSAFSKPKVWLRRLLTLLFLVGWFVLSTRFFCGASFFRRTAAFVLPSLSGGVGNQLFKMSSAALIHRATGRRVIVDGQQTGVFSFGVPQPVYWTTIFRSDLFLKVDDYDAYDDAKVELVREADFIRCAKSSFKECPKLSLNVRLSDDYLSFEALLEHRNFLRALYSPSSEVQRWVNDAAVRLNLVTQSFLESSTSASTHDERYLYATLGDDRHHTRNASSRIEDGLEREAWSCAPPPARCTRKILPLECAEPSCAMNVALHVRLQDRSTDSDYVSAHDLTTILQYVENALDAGKRVVVFSNDIPRAKWLLRSVRSTSNNMMFSQELNIVEFYLLSQYFGTHISTGSTFLQWAVFLSRFNHTNYVTHGINDDERFVDTFDHGSFMRFEHL